MKIVHLMLMLSVFLCLELRSTSGSDGPCFRHGLSCLTASEYCCDNLFCNNKTWVCEWINPPTTTPIYPTSTQWDCQRLDQDCSFDEDCCSGLSCTEGTCQYNHPTTTPSGPCVQIGAQCFINPDACCEGLRCNSDYQCEPDRPSTTTHPTTHRTHHTTHHTRHTTHRTPHTTHSHCQRINDNCSFDDDCCSGLSCTEGTCQYNHPKTTPSGPCVQIGAQCYINPDACCEGLRCNSDYQCEPDRPSTTTHPTTHRTHHTTHHTRHTTHRTPHTTHSHCQRINDNCDRYESCCSGLTCREGTCQHDQPTPTPSGPCIQIGAQCYTNPEACCEGLHCSHDFKCVSNIPSTTTRPTTHRTPSTTHRTHPTTHSQCQNINQHCDSEYWNCCDGLICSEGGQCQPNVPTEPPYTPCLKNGAQCNDSSSCCSGYCDEYWTGECDESF